MRISIITSTLNCHDALSATIKSVEMQSIDPRNLEWVVIDGGSTDGTLDLIRENSQKITKFISESDTGIYDAWNKAIPLVTGDWIIFMGAGDLFESSEVLERVRLDLSKIDPLQYRLVYGNVEAFSNYSERIVRYVEVDYQDFSNGRPALPPHQGTFQHKSLFMGRGEIFDPSYRVVSDSKFLIEAIRSTKLKYLSYTISRMPLLGVSNHPKYILLVYRELHRLRRELDISIGLRNQVIFTLRCTLKYVIYRVLGERLFFLIANLVAPKEGS